MTLKQIFLYDESSMGSLVVNFYGNLITAIVGPFACCYWTYTGSWILGGALLICVVCAHIEVRRIGKIIKERTEDWGD